MQLDARDLFSPRPTIMTLDALQKLKRDETLAVLVNDGKAVDELTLLANEHDCDFCVENEGDYTVVTLTPTHKVHVDNALEEALRMMGIMPHQAPVYLFGSRSMGQGNDELGTLLTVEALYNLSMQEDLPGAVVFYNSGATLTKSDSPALEALELLHKLGVGILTDSVSAEAYGTNKDLAIGEIVDPYIVVALISSQPGVISL